MGLLVDMAGPPRRGTFLPTPLVRRHRRPVCLNVAEQRGALGLVHQLAADSRSRFSIFRSRSRATASASGFPSGARRLAILSYDKCTPSGRSSTRIVTGA